MYSFLSEKDWLAWKNKRRKTTIGLVMVGTVVGIDSSIIFNTLYKYLKDLLHAEKPEMWFGIIISTFFTASAIFGGISSRWLDKTRWVRMYINVSLLIQAVGFIIYAIPYSPYNLLLGRFVCGIGEPFMSVVIGEVLRIYDGEESNRAIVWLGSTYSIGFIIGPSLNLIFMSIDFHIGWIRVTVVNFVSIFMTGCLLGVAVAANFLVSNCSAEFDLKEFLAQEEKIDSHKKAKEGEEKEEEQEQEQEQEEEEKEENDDDEAVAGESRPMLQTSLDEDNFISIQRMIYTLSRNIDAALILCSSFFLMYEAMVVTVWLPLVILNTLKWRVRGLSFFCLARGVTGLVSFTILSKRCKSNTHVYYTSIVSIIGMVLSYVSIIILQVKSRSLWTDIVVVAFFLISNTLCWMFEDVLSRIILGNMVPSQIQSFTEGFRAGLAKFGLIAGSLSSAFLYPYLTWSSVVLVTIVLVIIVIFLVRRKHLIDPKELTFDTKY